MRATCVTVDPVYHEVNGEIKVQTPLYPLVLEHLNSENLVKEWTEQHDEYGHWSCSLYTTPVGLIVRQDWVPNHGYAWRETRIYRLILGGGQ